MAAEDAMAERIVLVAAGLCLSVGGAGAAERRSVQRRASGHASGNRCGVITLVGVAIQARFPRSLAGGNASQFALHRKPVGSMAVEADWARNPGRHASPSWLDAVAGHPKRGLFPRLRRLFHSRLASRVRLDLRQGDPAPDSEKALMRPRLISTTCPATPLSRAAFCS